MVRSCLSGNGRFGHRTRRPPRGEACPRVLEVPWGCAPACIRLRTGSIDAANRAHPAIRDQRGGVTGQDSAARATLRRVDRISRSVARGQARSGTGRTGGRLEVALATLSADSGLRSAPTMSLPPRQRPVARRVWRLYVGNNDVSETVRERLRLSRHLRESARVRVRSKGCRKCVSTG